MSLEDEVTQLIRYELSDNPGVQRAFKEGGPSIQSDAEADLLVMNMLKALQTAVVRLAQEIDTMRASSG